MDCGCKFHTRFFTNYFSREMEMIYACDKHKKRMQEMARKNITESTEWTMNHIEKCLFD